MVHCSSGSRGGNRGNVPPRNPKKFQKAGTSFHNSQHSKNLFQKLFKLFLIFSKNFIFFKNFKFLLNFLKILQKFPNFFSRHRRAKAKRGNEALPFSLDPVMPDAPIWVIFKKNYLKVSKNL